MSTKNKTAYILGHSPAEIERLKAQAEILRPITERLLLSAGIGPGMRVLDIGCGAGDVAMLAAGLVGPSGSVVGIDRNPQVLAIARERARAAGLTHVAFEEASCPNGRGSHRGAGSRSSFPSSPVLACYGPRRRRHHPASVVRPQRGSACEAAAPSG